MLGGSNADKHSVDQKVRELNVDITKQIEMLAAAYSKATDIPPEECELVVKIGLDEISYSFRRKE